MMENRNPSSQSNLQSKAVLLKGLISRNGQGIGMQLRTEPCIEEPLKKAVEPSGLDNTTDTQHPIRELARAVSGK